jgi:HAD superfamily hydrolase (TIGR01509 family)
MAASLAVRLVCFDIGGVIVRICRTWEEASAAAGVPVRAPLTLELLLAVDSWSERLQLGEVTESDVAVVIAEAAGGLYSPAEILAIQAAILGEPYEDVTELVIELQRRRLATSVLSNTSAAHWHVLKELDAVKAIGAEILSFRVGVAKPAAEIYAAVEAAFAVDPRAIALFDDTTANVRAAEARGWRARLVDFAQPTAPQMRQALEEWGVLVPGA